MLFVNTFSFISYPIWFLFLSFFLSLCLSVILFFFLSFCLSLPLTSSSCLISLDRAFSTEGNGGVPGWLSQWSVWLLIRGCEFQLHSECGVTFKNRRADHESKHLTNRRGETLHFTVSVMLVLVLCTWPLSGSWGALLLRLPRVYIRRGCWNLSCFFLHRGNDHNFFV